MNKGKQWVCSFVQTRQPPINSLFVDVRRDGRDRCVAQCVRRVTYSVAPAAQQVVGHGVLWLQLNGFIQMILGGEADIQTDRQGEDFHCWFMTRLLFPLPSVLTWSVLLHQPTSISQTPLTHAISASDHTLLPVTHPPLFFSTLRLSNSALLFFISSLSSALSLSFTCQEFCRYTVFDESRWQKIKCYVPLFHTLSYATEWL